jgi:hypothetical protein
LKQIAVGRTGKCALVDEDDYDRVASLKWSVISSGYANNKTIGLMHRFILGAPKGMDVDHINGQTLDNRRSNLRICTRSENQRNKPAAGVSFNKACRKWTAQIKINRKKIHLGVFHTRQEAVAARREGERVHFGEFRWSPQPTEVAAQ